MAEHKVDIKAKTVEEFQEIEKRLEELPTLVYEQIKIAEFGLSGLKCEFNDFFSNKHDTIYVPEFRLMTHKKNINWFYTKEILFVWKRSNSIEEYEIRVVNKEGEIL
jgi:hypothetical protein